ncbi:LigA [Burkholderia ambifaria]
MEVLRRQRAVPHLRLGNADGHQCTRRSDHDQQQGADLHRARRLHVVERARHRRVDQHRPADAGERDRCGRQRSLRPGRRRAERIRHVLLRRSRRDLHAGRHPVQRRARLRPAAACGVQRRARAVVRPVAARAPQVQRTGGRPHGRDAALRCAREPQERWRRWRHRAERPRNGYVQRFRYRCGLPRDVEGERRPRLRLQGRHPPGRRARPAVLSDPADHREGRIPARLGEQQGVPAQRRLVRQVQRPARDAVHLFVLTLVARSAVPHAWHPAPFHPAGSRCVAHRRRPSSRESV